VYNQYQFRKNISGTRNKHTLKNNHFHNDSISKFLRLQKKYKQTKNQFILNAQQVLNKEIYVAVAQFCKNTSL
ncbi:hypothetical protein, partial [Pedobacter sp.]